MTTDKTKNFFRVSAEDFKKIPGSPIAYWVSDNTLNAYCHTTMKDIAEPRHGLATSNNDLFLKQWSEVDIRKTSMFGEFCSSKWFPMNKGGSFRKWYGNNEWIINYENDGRRIKDYAIAIYRCSSRTIQNTAFYFQEGVTWSALTSGSFSVRYSPKGAIFGSGGYCAFPLGKQLHYILALLNSKIADSFLKLVSPTLNYEVGHIKTIPVIFSNAMSVIDSNTKKIISRSEFDWDSYETSWDFQTNPLLAVGNGLNMSGTQFDLSAIYIALRRDWQRQTEEMRRLEIENNRIFIDAYGLQDELSPEVPWNEITLTCNPWYRYGKSPEDADLTGNSFCLDGTTAQINPTSTQDNGCPDEDFPFAHDTEQRLLEETMKEYISYAVGCMMGRYSPEKPGLILVNQGDGFAKYNEILSGTPDNPFTNDQTKEKSFGPFSREYVENFLQNVDKAFPNLCPYTEVTCNEVIYHTICDQDGVIPILEEEWFIDDIVAQFKQFLRFTFGEEHFADNLDFIEKALGKDLRKYFLKDFYKDHVQRYKKRPIYWLFSSPKGSFNALIYMHRYRPDTVSIVLNEYLREFISKIRAKREHLIGDNNRTTLSPAEKTRNLKQIDKYAAMLTELDAYERDILYPLAQEKIAIDLDDGVKVNYCKFGTALKKIPGLEAKEE